VEALAHEHRNTLLAGEHVDQLELDAPVAVAVAHCLDVADRGIPPRRSPANAERPGMWMTMSSAKKPKPVSQSPLRTAAM
jgi:hypothetical protein